MDISPVTNKKKKKKLAPIAIGASKLQCLGQQFVVAVEESDWAVAIQQGSGALALVQQDPLRDDTLSHGGWQAGGMLSLEGVLQDCQQLIGSLHTLPSVMMHKGDASFLVGHLWLLCIVSPW